MKVPQVFLFLLAFVTTIHALALPAYLDSVTESTKELFKRKGGGGGGGRGGGGGGRSSSSSSGSKSGSGSSSGGSRGSSSSGATRAPPSFGGSSSKYYGGGAATPYRAGAPTRGVSPALIGGGAALFLFPALAYGAYSYGYPGYYNYYNRTSQTNESHPINCYCGRYSDCGCEPNNDTEYLTSVANNGSVAKLVNNTLQLDGTLNNETVSTNAASGLQQGLWEMSGLWVVVAGVTYTMWFM